MSYSKSSTMRSVKTQYRSDRIDLITGRKANWQVIIRTPISEVFKIIRISLPKIRSPVVVRGLLWYQQFALQIELYTGSLKAGASVGCGYLIRFVKLMTLHEYRLFAAAKTSFQRWVRVLYYLPPKRLFAVYKARFAPFLSACFFCIASINKNYT